MINPYLPNMTRIKNAYDVLKKSEEMEQTRKMSLTHPYKTEEEVLRELKRDESRAHEVFSKMSPELRKDQEVMLRFIKESEVAYLYINPSINTLEFKQRALIRNPSVYGMLSNQDRQEQPISDSYLNGMIDSVQRRQIDATEYAYQFPHQFSEKTNIAQIFSNETYDRAFRNMLQNGPYENHALCRDFAIISTARLLRPEAQKQYDEIERNAWMQNEQVINKLAYDDRRLLSVDYALTAIEERCPEYKPTINQRQKEFWTDRKQELLDLQDRQDNGVRLNGEEIGLLREAQKHIELTREQKKVEQYTQRVREEELVYLKRDAVERAYSAAADGDISFSEAADIAAYVGNAPNTAKHSSAVEHIASCTAKVNDIDNIDEEREIELDEFDQEAEEIVQEDIAEQEYAIAEQEYETEEEPEYVPWNYSPPDVERTPEYKPY